MSIKVLQFTFVVQNNGLLSVTAFYYDANLPYFGWPHALLGVFAILCLLVVCFSSDIRISILPSQDIPEVSVML